MLTHFNYGENKLTVSSDSGDISISLPIVFREVSVTQSITICSDHGLSVRDRLIAHAAVENYISTKFSSANGFHVLIRKVGRRGLQCAVSKTAGHLVSRHVYIIGDVELAKEEEGTDDDEPTEIS